MLFICSWFAFCMFMCVLKGGVCVLKSLAVLLFTACVPFVVAQCLYLCGAAPNFMWLMYDVF